MLQWMRTGPWTIASSAKAAWFPYDAIIWKSDSLSTAWLWRTEKIQTRKKKLMFWIIYWQYKSVYSFSKLCKALVDEQVAGKLWCIKWHDKREGIVMWVSRIQDTKKGWCGWWALEMSMQNELKVSEHVVMCTVPS